MKDHFAQLLIAEFDRRIYQESIPRISQCLRLLSDEEIWYAHNQHTNSIGNLILHLCGNVTQWIGSGIGDLEDLRMRDNEFDGSQRASRAVLLSRLHGLKEITDAALPKLSERNLDAQLKIQGFEETPLSIVIHVIEHFSYHTGQIAQMTKILRARDLGFYDGVDLNQK